MEIKSRNELTVKLGSAMILLEDVMSTMSRDDILIADIPAPGKKTRKKRAKKVDKEGTQEPKPEPPKLRGRTRGSKNKNKEPFGPPTLRLGETPV